jgi:ribosomal protein S20
MKRILLVAFAMSIFAVGACASSGDSAKKDMAKAPAADPAWDKKVADAEAGLKALQKNDARWRDTGNWGKGKKQGYLKKAIAAHNAGDKAKAEKLMKKVNSQIKMAGMQYEAEKNAGPTY